MFYNKTQYPNLAILEEGYPEIFAEFKTLTPARMRNWPEYQKYEGVWKVCGLVHEGRRLESCCDLCPRTMDIIDKAGQVRMAGFSRMGPGTEILPHVDDVKDYVDRVHLGVQIPEGDCGIWVDGTQTKWQNGKAFLFDPLLIHKAWNRTTEDRIILLVDFEDFC